jgi:hypothetical protein
MHTDVDDDPGRPQGLARQIAHLVGRIDECPELLHEPLGVEGPSLAVAGDESLEPLEPGQALALEDGGGDLEVMARDRLVVPGGDQTPQGKRSWPRVGNQVVPGRLRSSLGEM